MTKTKNQKTIEERIEKLVWPWPIYDEDAERARKDIKRFVGNIIFETIGKFAREIEGGLDELQTETNDGCEYLFEEFERLVRRKARKIRQRAKKLGIKV